MPSAQRPPSEPPSGRGCSRACLAQRHHTCLRGVSQIDYPERLQTDCVIDVQLCTRQGEGVGAGFGGRLPVRCSSP